MSEKLAMTTGEYYWSSKWKWRIRVLKERPRERKRAKKKLELYEGFTLCASKLVALCSYCIVCYCWCCYFLICKFASHQETTISCLIQHNLRRGIYSYSVHAISFHLPVECIRYVASVTGTVFCVSLMYLLLHRANISLVSRIRIPISICLHKANFSLSFLTDAIEMCAWVTSFQCLAIRSVHPHLPVSCLMYWFNIIGNVWSLNSLNDGFMTVAVNFYSFIKIDWITDAFVNPHIHTPNAVCRRNEKIDCWPNRSVCRTSHIRNGVCEHVVFRSCHGKQ